MGSSASQRTYWFILVIYAVCAVILSLSHECFRDEVLPASLAMQAQSLPSLLDSIRNYGHPGLWYTLLYGLKQLFPSYVILNILNLLIAFLAAYIFLIKAPFTLFHRVLFLLGYFPFYYFTAVNRNYGLSWLLFLLFCVLYEERWRRLLSLGAVLFLLANAHAAGLIISVVVTVSLLWELSYERREEILKLSSWRVISLFLLIVTAGVLVSCWQMMPDSSCDLDFWKGITTQKAVVAIGAAIFLPGKVFPYLLGGASVILASLAIAVAYVMLFKERAALLIVAGGVVSIGLFFQLFYPIYSLYHQSFIYMLIIFACWVFYKSSWMSGLRGRMAGIFMTLLLSSQIVMSYQALKADLSGEFSSSKRLASWLKEQPNGTEYVLIGEPDYLLWSLPYYVDHDIYVPRERRFSKVTRNSTANQMVFSLSELLNAGQELRRQGRKVFFIIGHTLSAQGPFEIDLYLNKRFVYSPDDFLLWQANTKKVAGFHDAFGDENYDVYELK